jgi:hypothetical protein
MYVPNDLTYNTKIAAIHMYAYLPMYVFFSYVIRKSNANKNWVQNRVFNYYPYTLVICVLHKLFNR